VERAMGIHEQGRVLRGLVCGVVLGCTAGAVLPELGVANERRFAYVYETPVLSPGARELEIWNTYRSGKEYMFRRLDQRIEMEFGVADRLMTAFYLNYEWVASDDNGALPGGTLGSEQTASISNEWKYKIADRVADPLGAAVYAEYTFGLLERELEMQVILDKQFGRFLFAGNLVGEHEWEDDMVNGVTETERELTLGVRGGVAYSVSAQFSLGVEVVEQNILKEGTVEHAALFAGPVLSYATDDWWATLTVMPQVAALKGETVDGLDLGEFERSQVRLLLSFHL
jgi:hypothetical protein